jgi:hypothetical protein
VKDTVAASDLPSRCRRWDKRRRAWVPKDRYASEQDARKATGGGMQAYPCPAAKVGRHWHVGHDWKGKR